MLRKRRYTNDRKKNSSETKIVTNSRVHTLDVLFTF